MSTTRNSELWQRLRAARTHAELTQTEVAKRLNITRPAVSQWEADEVTKRTTPSGETLRTLAQLYKVPLDWLMDDTADVNDLVKGTVTYTSKDRSLARAQAFWQAVQLAVFVEFPEGKDNFNVQLTTPLRLTVPLRTSKAVVNFATYDGEGETMEQMFEREVAHLLLMRTMLLSRREKPDAYLMVWARPGVNFDEELVSAVEKTFDVNVEVVRDLTTATAQVVSLL